MTLWAFVSDIHGNRAALDRVAAWCDARGVERYICLGDVIGRGDPNGCVAWVRDHASIAIVGNRDLDYLDRIDPRLQEVVLGWPNEARATDFVVSHGEAKLHRVLNSGAIREDFRGPNALMEEGSASIWFFGHTHNARLWRWVERSSFGGCGMRHEPSPDGELAAPNRLTERCLVLEPGFRYAVNVGTTGLPLPGRGGGAFATYDDQLRQIEIVPTAELTGH